MHCYVNILNMLLKLYTKLLPNRSWCSIVQRGHKALLIDRKVKDVISVNYNFFSSQWNEEIAYIIGFILADGHIHLEQIIFTNRSKF